MTRSHPPGRQRGVALFTVMVFVLLSMLLALWASRSALFNEMIVGNDADYQRAYEAAQALLTDAERDIRRVRIDNTSCALDCLRRTSGAAEFPRDMDGYTKAIASGQLKAIPDCKNGLCLLDTKAPQDFWNDKSAFETMTQPGAFATYGQYTGVVQGAGHSNFILNGRGGYWIEIIPSGDKNACSPGLIVGGAQTCLPVSADPPFVYRITAVAKGRKDSTMVVLQQTYYSHRDDTTD